MIKMRFKGLEKDEGKQEERSKKEQRKGFQTL